MYRDFEITPGLIYIIVITWHFVRVLVLHFIYLRRPSNALLWNRSNDIRSHISIYHNISIYTSDDNEQ